jgi:hypothetical protein
MDYHCKELNAKIQPSGLIEEHLNMKWNINDSAVRWIQQCQDIWKSNSSFPNTQIGMADSP